MYDLAQMWAEGGTFMYPIALLALLSLPAAPLVVILAVVGRRGSRVPLILSTVLCALGLLILATGFLGWQMALRNVEEAVAHVNPDDREIILAAGRSEARVLIMFGAAACLPSLLTGVALLGLGLSRLPRYTPPPGPGGAAPAR